MVDLITGASGFVGKALVQAMLKRGKCVRILVRQSSKLEGLESLGLEIVYGDLKSKRSLLEATKGVDNVIHLAFKRQGKSLEDMNGTNVRGIKHLLEACRVNKVKHLVFFSSVTVYGEALDIHENSPFQPYDNYGKSKVEVERLVAKFREETRIPVTTLRPSYIYGPGDSFSIFQMIGRIKKKQFVKIGSGENLMNFIYIDDVVDATLNILKAKSLRDRDYILSADTVSLNELTGMIAKSLNTMDPIKIPYSAGYCLGLGFDVLEKVTGKRMPVSRQRAKNMVRSRSFRTERSRKEMGFVPKIHLEEGIKNTIEWANSHKLI